MSSKNGKDISATPATPVPAPDKKVIATLFASLDEADKHISKARATLEAANQKRSLLLSNLAQAIAPETRFSRGGVVYTIVQRGESFFLRSPQQPTSVLSLD